MSKRVTLADIARASQVSQSTASLVLRDRPGIPPETRERVFQAAQTLGYRPKSQTVERGVKTAETSQRRSVGVLVKTEPNTPPQANPFYSHVLAGIADACLPMGLNLLYAHLPVDERNLPIELPPVLTENHVNGLILVGMYVTETLGRMLREGGLPVVLVDAYAAANGFDLVLSDNIGGARQAVAHLIQKGHRRIAILGGEPDAYPSLRERREGALQALAAAGLEGRYLTDCPTYDQARPAVTALLTAHPEITALFACNDTLAIEATQAIMSLGRRTPDDLSLVGFDDLDMARYLTPSLTTMHVDKTGMGRVAVQLLKNHFDFPDSGQATVIMKPHLVERDSVRHLEA